MGIILSTPIFAERMNLEVLMNEYANDTRCFQIVDGISLPKPGYIHLNGLQGSVAAFVMAAVFNNPSCSRLNHLVVLRDPEEAAYFHNTLENLTGALDIFYFPSSFKNKKNYRLLNSSHVMLRTEALTKIATAAATVGIGHVNSGRGSDHRYAARSDGSQSRSACCGADGQHAIATKRRQIR